VRRSLSAPVLGAIAFLFLFTTVADAGGWLSRRDKHKSVDGSGVLETRVLDFEDFDGIDLDGVADIEINVGEAFSVELIAEDNIIDFVELGVRRGHLQIDLDDDQDIETDEGILLRISMPELRELDLSGVYNVTAQGIDNEKLKIVADGVGEVTLEGKTDQLRVAKGGVGKVDLRDLVAQFADVDANGVGEVIVFVEQELEAEANGIGNVEYYGNPVHVHGETAGLGTVKSGG
jgi:Putative auto-transporter adhesin, head GIN domain